MQPPPSPSPEPPPSSGGALPPTVQPPTVVIQSPPSTTPDFPTWFDYAVAIGTAFGSLAAIAAGIAAYAAVRQAERSTQAARDSLEALGRALRPDDLTIGAVHRAGRDPQDLTVADTWPGPLQISVVNRNTQYGATFVQVQLTHVNGKVYPTVGPVAVTANGQAELSVKNFEPATPAPDSAQAPGEEVTVEHRLSLEYRDERGILLWRQTMPLRETAALRADKLEPVPQWVFIHGEATVPELIKKPR